MCLVDTRKSFLKIVWNFHQYNLCLDYFQMSVGCINLNSTSERLWIRRIRSVPVFSYRIKEGARTSYIMENSRIRCFRLQHNSYTSEFLYFLVLQCPVRQVLRYRHKQALCTRANEPRAMGSKLQKPPYITPSSFPLSRSPTSFLFSAITTESTGRGNRCKTELKLMRLAGLVQRLLTLVLQQSQWQ